MVAFDHLRVNLSHLEFAYKYLEVIQQVFQEEVEWLIKKDLIWKL